MDRLNRLFLAIISATSLVVIALQVPVVQEQRGKTYDAQAVTDLQDIDSAISSYMLSNDDLPTNLDGLSLSSSTKGRLDRYDYKPGSGGSYELCATFKRSTRNDSSTSSTTAFASHPKGHHCFKEEAGFGFDDEFDFSDFGSQSNTFELGGAANDTEVRTDINSVQSHLEAYYAMTGYYPSKGDLQNASWRTANLPGLDSEAVEGPNGERLGSGYTYTASPTGCQSDCSSFTLSAELSDGTMYTKQSF